MAPAAFDQRGESPCEIVELEYHPIRQYGFVPDACGPKVQGPGGDPGLRFPDNVMMQVRSDRAKIAPWPFWRQT
jgi:hypothetical protein